MDTLEDRCSQVKHIKHEAHGSFPEVRAKIQDEDSAKALCHRSGKPHRGKFKITRKKFQTLWITEMISGVLKSTVRPKFVFVS